jgi:hypothetical protein
MARIHRSAAQWQHFIEVWQASGKAPPNFVKRMTWVTSVFANGVSDLVLNIVLMSNNIHRLNLLIYQR